MIANTPKPPYYAVIFTSKKSEETPGYAEMSNKMFELAAQQEGYLGVESENGITISYWKSLEAIQKWKKVPDHLEAQKKGRAEWYSAFKVRIAKVERDYGKQP